MRKSILVFITVLLMLVGITLTASASQPNDFEGYFYDYAPGDPTTPTVYCITTFDGAFNGCVVQPWVPGLAAHGTFTGTFNGASGTCEYNLRTFLLDGIARFVMNRCTGDLAGLHMRGVGWTNGLWEGTYHFDP